MLTVGQKLLFVPNGNRGRVEEELTVERVGRKWAYVGYRDRIDMETLVMDGGDYSSPGRCYLSKQAYEEDKALKQEWYNFKRAVDRNVPKGVTIEKIKQALEILGI